MIDYTKISEFTFNVTETQNIIETPKKNILINHGYICPCGCVSFYKSGGFQMGFNNRPNKYAIVCLNCGDVHWI